LRIGGGYESFLSGSSRFALTMPAAVFVVAVVNRECEACLDDFVERGALLLGLSAGFAAYFTVARSFR
jgi:hypothetical protein